ncbi:hypothetical protein JN09_000976 [Acholeplasma morum]|jgi:hypothetical protein|uniref:YolD-like family protein n=1 Tax=Paracholeplasma morum TaxID=264637 RepID=UPI00195758C2|nr:YolD-like family protein [Paracholeplasma morum]MBM7453644.1 hypothetical protein [Paracholeplasma morum]
MASYQDRGLMKWHPFDALAGYHEMINEMIYLKNKRDKPVLFEDALVEMDRIIKEAIRLNKIVRISYYLDGYIYYQVGEIVKYDGLYRKLIMCPRLSLSLDDIVQIDEIN